jgi:uncharacterized protein
MREVIIKKVKEAVLKLEPSAEVILYGSRARNDFREYSDWDFLILVDGKVNTTRTDKLRNALYDIELDTDQVISSIIRSKQDWSSSKYSVVPLHKNIKREGIRI